MTGEATPRAARMHSLFDAATGRGLEVGPLHDPVVRRAQGDVRYVDVRDRDGLCAEYASHEGFPLDQIVEQDYVLLDEDGRVRPLPEAVGAGAPFDWVVASHVIEHVPDVITWLQEVADVLVDGGSVVLAIPDRRVTFDVDRSPTTVGEMLLAQRSGDVRPSVRAVYDHYSRCRHINPLHVWNGEQPGERMYDVSTARKEAARAESGDYVDCHVWVWTPASFVEQLSELADLGLCELTVERVIDTARDDIEFYALLRRLPRGVDDDARERLQHSSIREWCDVEIEPLPEAEPEPEPVVAGTAHDSDEAVAASLSPAEARLVRAKRRLVHATRSALSRRGRPGGGVRRD